MYTSWQLMCKCYRFPLIFVLLLENVTCSTRRPLGPQYMSWALCVNHDVYIGPKSRLTIRFFFCVYNLNSNYFFSFFPMFSYVLFFPTTFLIVCLHLYSCSSLHLSLHKGLNPLLSVTHTHIVRDDFFIHSLVLTYTCFTDDKP